MIKLTSNSHVYSDAESDLPNCLVSSLIGKAA